MSERIIPTGSPEDMPFRIESKEPKKVKKVERSSTDLKIKKEPNTDTFESTQASQKEETPTKEDKKENPKDQDVENSKEEGLDIYA